VIAYARPSYSAHPRRLSQVAAANNNNGSVMGVVDTKAIIFLVMGIGLGVGLYAILQGIPARD
jgi:hypothetical protein